MGRLVAATIAAADDLALTGCYDPGGGDPMASAEISKDPAGLTDADVVVEFTHPDVVMQNLVRWHDAGMSAVVGTSGFDDARLQAVRDVWVNPDTRCLIVPNFAIGAVLMMRMAELASPFFPAADIIEFHHEPQGRCTLRDRVGHCATHVRRRRPRRACDRVGGPARWCHRGEGRRGAHTLRALARSGGPSTGDVWRTGRDADGSP